MLVELGGMGMDDCFRPEAVTPHHIPGLKAWIAELTVHDAVQQHVIND